MRYFKTILFFLISAFLINPVISQKIEKGKYQSFLGFKIDPITHKEVILF